MAAKGYNTLSVILLSTSVVILGYILTTPWFPIERETKINLGYPKDSLLNFTELTSKYGYISEEHKLVTEDGYILTIFRITGGRKCNGKIKSPPVFLMHGLLQSSDSFIDAGPDSGLAYLISDACHDLWVGNNRGNYYSRHHIHLNPDKDPEYWNFYIDEIGKYDLPAMIDYVLDYTESEKLNYVGFSQGCGIYLVMCSEKPKYCEKAQIVIALAPAARHLNSKSNLYRGVAHTMGQIERTFSTFASQEVLSKGSFYQEFVNFFCHVTGYTRNICQRVMDIFDHIHSYHGSINDITTDVLFGHFPAGTSLRNMARYSQSLNSRHFEKFDYGKEKNLVVYGSEEPPRYNLSAAIVPMTVIYGQNDGLVDPKDIKWLVSQLPNVLELVQVQDPLWNHMDVTYSQYIGQLIFPKINEYLLKYSRV